jgi:hypothetical protein
MSYFPLRRKFSLTIDYFPHNLFESRSGRGVQHYVIKIVSDLQQVGGFLRFPPPIKLTATI